MDCLQKIAQQGLNLVFAPYAPSWRAIGEADCVSLPEVYGGTSPKFRPKLPVRC